MHYVNAYVVLPSCLRSGDNFRDFELYFRVRRCERTRFFNRSFLKLTSLLGVKGYLLQCFWFLWLEKDKIKEKTKSFVVIHE